MINLNNVCLVGRLTKEIDLRKTQSNKSVCNFTVAVNRRFVQEGQQEADFISVIAWNQSADFLAKYANKGTIVGVEGRLATRSYDDKDGKKVYVTEVVADHVQIISERKGEVAPTQEPRASGGYEQYEPVRQQHQEQYQQQYHQQSLGGQVASTEDRYIEDNFRNTPSLDISSDDLPFY